MNAMHIAIRPATSHALSHRCATTQRAWPVPGAWRAPVELPRPHAAGTAHEQEEATASASLVSPLAHAPEAAVEAERRGTWFSSVASQATKVVMLLGVILAAEEAASAPLGRSTSTSSSRSFGGSHTFRTSYSGAAGYFTDYGDEPLEWAFIAAVLGPWALLEFLPILQTAGQLAYSAALASDNVILRYLVLIVACFSVLFKWLARWSEPAVGRFRRASNAASGGADSGGAKVDHAKTRANRSTGQYVATVAKVQVGLLALGDTIKSDLNLMAVSADTSSRAGLHRLMQETVMVLLRNPSHCVYGGVSANLLFASDTAERSFNTMCMEERSKVKYETLVNVNGTKSRKSVTVSSSSPSELVVVSLTVAVARDLQLPRVRSLADLKLAMSKLGSVAANDVMAVEVFWTPQADGDVLTEQECQTMYPNMSSLLG